MISCIRHEYIFNLPTHGVCELIFFAGMTRHNISCTYRFMGATWPEEGKGKRIITLPGSQQHIWIFGTNGKMQALS